MAAKGEQVGPIGLISLVLSVLLYILAVLNLIALWGGTITTIRMAPVEIKDILGSLRQQICEERWALRQQRKELRARLDAARLRRHRTPAHHDADSIKADDNYSSYGSSDKTNSTDLELLRLSLSEHTLTLHQQNLRDLWQQFKALERPFLVASGRRAEAMRRGDGWTDKNLTDDEARADMEAHGEAGSFASWTALYRCNFGGRFLWWRTKGDVRRLADKVSRLMMMRTEREVSHIRMMVKGIVEQGSSSSYGGGQGTGTQESSLDGATLSPLPSPRTRSISSEDEETQDSSAKAAVDAGGSEVQRQSSIVSEWRERPFQARQARNPRSPPRVVHIRSSRGGRRTEYMVRPRPGGGPGGPVRVEEHE
ncbi:hypothetical protein MAPG_12115 [Magnaporthiopsis poae ATCC 64411]|uniref:Uncharacterized protein n=1 Tax=Magnaporthiopsis poae (strain ATCC 64411 / 73-15) TaxID=644358 RepID=A0A0C4EGV5_MAGP6|nr:hypothetical protein MAPG_12115 [Magnaporthiopsis poae ATCC 64411]